MLCVMTEVEAWRPSSFPPTRNRITLSIHVVGWDVWWDDQLIPKITEAIAFASFASLFDPKPLHLLRALLEVWAARPTRRFSQMRRRTPAGSKPTPRQPEQHLIILPRATSILAFSSVNCWSKTVETLRASCVSGKRDLARASSQWPWTELETFWRTITSVL